jgi:hypothetical protein
MGMTLPHPAAVFDFVPTVMFFFSKSIWLQRGAFQRKEPSVQTARLIVMGSSLSRSAEEQLGPEQLKGVPNSSP